jgi:hypothetical protein
MNLLWVFFPMRQETHQRRECSALDKGTMPDCEFKSGTFLTVPRLGSHSVGFPKENTMPLGTILLIILVVLLIGALPTWPYSGGWGYYPSGGLGLLLVIVLILLLLGRL